MRRWRFCNSSETLRNRALSRKGGQFGGLSGGRPNGGAGQGHRPKTLFLSDSSKVLYRLFYYLHKIDTDRFVFLEIFANECNAKPAGLVVPVTGGDPAG